MAHHKPVIDQRAAEQMNLNVLKRMDPQIEEVRRAAPCLGGRGLSLALSKRAAHCSPANLGPAAAGHRGARGAVRLRHPHQALGALLAAWVPTLSPAAGVLLLLAASC